MNVVKFKVKQEYMQEYMQKAYQHKPFDGMINEYYVQVGDNEFIAVGLWQSEQKMIEARPAMIAFLDTIRHTLEELSPELGVTDPSSGPVMFESSN